MLCNSVVKDKEYAPPNLSEGTPEQERRRRPWELWSLQDKNLFFEGLFEVCYTNIFLSIILYISFNWLWNM